MKGTSADCEVGSTGNTSCTGRTGTTEIQGQYGPPQELPPNNMSLVIGNRPASETIKVEAGEGGQEGKSFAKVSPTSGQSSSLAGEKEALGTGVIDPKQLEDSKKEGVGVGESLKQEIMMESSKQDEETEADAEFEKDLQDSEEGVEEIAMDVTGALDLTGVADVDTDAMELPDVNVEEDIEDAIEESKDLKARLRMTFEK